MNLLRRTFSLSVIAVYLLAVHACSKDDNTDAADNSMASTNFSASAVLNSGRSAALNIESFMVNVSEIELEFDDDNSNGDTYDDLELDGPFEILFTPEGGTVPIATVDIPIATYEELEFDISRSEDPTSSLFNKSVLISGSVDGIPFLFWHNFSEDLEIDFEDTNSDITIENNGETIVFNFDLSVLFDNSLVDISSAQDGNGDGIIEISPNDPDGNRDLADRIKDLIKENIDLLDD